MSLSQDRRLGNCVFEMAGGIIKGSEDVYQLAKDNASRQANLKVLGYLESPERMLAACDDLRLPHRFGASVLGVVFCEAMVAGWSCAASDINGLRDLVNNGYTGYLLHD